MGERGAEAARAKLALHPDHAGPGRPAVLKPLLVTGKLTTKDGNMRN